MLEAAREAARQAGLAKLIAVTVLTSLDAKALADLPVAGQPEGIARRLALLAKECGLDGVVCSAADLPGIRSACGPEFFTVVPGIRPAGADVGDQKRIATPAAAIAAGADVLVVGRPVTAAPDPEAALAAILAEVGRRSGRAHNAAPMRRLEGASPRLDRGPPRRAAARAREHDRELRFRRKLRRRRDRARCPPDSRRRGRRLPRRGDRPRNPEAGGPHVHVEGDREARDSFRARRIPHPQARTGFPSLRDGAALHRRGQELSRNADGHDGAADREAGRGLRLSKGAASSVPSTRSFSAGCARRRPRSPTSFIFDHAVALPAPGPPAPLFPPVDAIAPRKDLVTPALLDPGGGRESFGASVDGRRTGRGAALSRNAASRRSRRTPRTRARDPRRHRDP